MTLPQPLRLVAAFVVVVSAAACGSTAGSSARSSSTPVTTAPSASTPSTTTEKPSAVITIKNFNFGSPVSVNIGATVTVHNADDTAHTVSAADGSFNTKPIFAGTTITFVAPMTPGSYKFHCNIHANMQGTLTVTG